jgi:AcrR family transcriptional regulator
VNVSAAGNNMEVLNMDDNKARKKKEKIQLKAPTQERSRQTVTTILNACRIILIREGFFGVTTDKIAKEANVSIGSLYQFFGNKESVVSAVIHDMFKSDQEFILEKLRDLDVEAPVDLKIRLFLDAGIEAYSKNIELRSKLQNIQTYLMDESIYNSIMQSYQAVIEKHLPQLSDSRSRQTVAYMIVTTFVGLMDKAVFEVKDIKTNKSFHEELFRMISCFIKAA